MNSEKIIGYNFGLTLIVILKQKAVFKNITKGENIQFF